MERKLRLKAPERAHKGKLIVFEGTDGAGKTTLLRLTEKYLESKLGIGQVLVVKQPTDLSRKTKLFQKMMYSVNHEDIDYRAVQLLTLSDRVQHNHEVILPALREGKVVICDRYLYTSVANMRARGYWRERWFFAAARSIRKPDLTFLAYVPPACAIARIRSRPEECSRHLNEALLSAAAREFLKLKKSEGFTLIDTETDAERAFASVREKLDELMEKKR